MLEKIQHSKNLNRLNLLYSEEIAANGNDQKDSETQLSYYKDCHQTMRNF